MKCPKCNSGQLLLYKETELSSHYKISKNGKIYKHPFSTNIFETEKDYLECKNTECNQWYDYELDKFGTIKLESMREK